MGRNGSQRARTGVHGHSLGVCLPNASESQAERRSSDEGPEPMPFRTVQAWNVRRRFDGLLLVTGARTEDETG